MGDRAREWEQRTRDSKTGDRRQEDRGQEDGDSGQDEGDGRCDGDWKRRTAASTPQHSAAAISFRLFTSRTGLSLADERVRLVGEF